MNILAIRVGRVGDTVMLTPALNELIAFFPDARITLLTSPAGKHLLSGFHPNVVAIWSWQRSGLLRPLLDKRRIRRELARTHFDKVFCFDNSPRVAALFQHMGDRFHWFQTPDEPQHCARYYLDFVAKSCARPTLDHYNTLPTDAAASKQVDAELRQHGILPNDTVIMFHPTFSGFNKSRFRKKQARLRKLWPVENYGALARSLCQLAIPGKGPVKILMVLLPDEMDYGRKIVEHGNRQITLLPSESTFERYKAMLKRANLLVTPDSGPMHIASALGTPIVALFSMKDPGDCGPYMPPGRFRILRSEDTDSPEKGVAAIPVERVLESCRSLLLSPGPDTRQPAR